LTSKFSNKKEALTMGLFYAGSKQKVEDVTPHKTASLLKNPPFADDKDAFNVEIYDAIGEKGKVQLGIEECKGTFFLWLIDPTSKFSIRA